MKKYIKKLADYLIQNKTTITVAESLTGGLISSMLCEASGISEVFLEGIVVYTNNSKITRLGVKKETIDKYTAVSAEVAIEMAEGVRRNLSSDIGISTTGLAGPLEYDEFGNKKGTVFVGISIESESFVYKFNFDGNRDQIRNKSAESCILKLLDILERKGNI